MNIGLNRSTDMMFMVIFAIVVLPYAMGCPRQEDLRPCTCVQSDDEGSAFVTCAGLDNEQDLVNAVNALKDKYYVYSLVIEDSTFNFIPSDAFRGAKFVELEIKDTTLMALTDTEVAFEGLEDRLQILLMTDCTFMNEWDWSVFRNLRRLMRFDIIRGDLQSIDGDLGLMNITSVEDISFGNNRISHVDSDAFSNFENLKFLSLDNNKIAELKRSMLPNPALELLQIDISYNQIEELPPDMFASMPNLQTLSMSKNKILVLHEDTFSPIWEQLESFNAMGNELRCDCRMSWLLKMKHPTYTRAVCAYPQEVRGRGIEHLSSKDVWCLKK